MDPRIKHQFRIASWIAASLVALLGTAATQPEALRRYVAHTHYEPRYFLPSTEALPWLSLGFREAFADVIFVRALVYYGEELHHRGSLDFFDSYALAAIQLDPYFRRAYLWGGSVGLYRTQNSTIPESSFLSAIALLKQGYARFKPDGEFAWELGSVMAYEYLPTLEDGARKTELKAEAAEYLSEAAELGAGPAWLSLSSSSTLMKLGKRERARSFLQRIFPAVTDPAMKARIRRRLAILDAEDIAERQERGLLRINAARKHFFPQLSLRDYLVLRAHETRREVKPPRRAVTRPEASSQDSP